MVKQISKVKDGIKRKKFSIASVFIILLITIGLGLLGIQTYNAITGSNLSLFNLDIGSLWSNDDESKNIDKNDARYQPEAVVRKISLPPTLPTPSRFTPEKITPPKKFTKTRLSIPNKVTAESSNIFTSQFISNLRPIKMQATSANNITIKYLERIENNYLVNPNITPTRGKWYVGVSFVPALSYRRLNYNPEMISGVSIDGNKIYNFGLTENERNLTDNFIPSFNVGLDVGRSFGKRWNIQTGIYYSEYGEQLSVAEISDQDPNRSSAAFYNKSPSYQAYNSETSKNAIPFSNKYAYVEVPLSLSYNVVQRDKTTFAVEAGVAFQKLDHVDALVYDFKTDYFYWFNKKQNLFRANNINTNIGVSVSQFIGNKVEMYLKPTLMYNWQSTFNVNYAASQNQYATGLKMGIRQHF